MLKGFRDFILRGNVVDLGVALVIGSAFTGIVTALVKDFITPLIGAFGGQPNFSGLTLTVNHSKFLIGDFINALISFLIVSAVVYFFVVLPMNKLLTKLKRDQPTAPTDKICPECLSSIPLKAHRCKFCASIQKN